MGATQNALNRLPAEMASFVGRSTVLRELDALLETTRLLTITGPGGSGKTRVALRLAQMAASRYPDGLTLASLAPVSESRLVARTVAAALGIRGVAGRPLLATLATVIGSRHILIVFDNCEHVIGASAHLAEALLRACPRLRILATSREPLRVAGESVFRLAPFDVPEPQTSPESVARNEAVTLFIERAHARVPRLNLTDDAVLDIATICRRVGGLPLAIELAAAQVGSLTVRQVAERLDDSLGLLRRGSRTDARQETLRGTLDWSYDLLTESERFVFRRLAVFAGSFDLDAAVGIATDCGAGEGAILDSLASLVGKSLIEIDARAEPVSYRLLEPIRNYAGERLGAAGETDSIRRRHAAYYTSFVETAEPFIRSGGRRPWMARLVTAEDNMLAALTWTRHASEQEDREIGLRLAGSLVRFWNFRGQVVAEILAFRKAEHAGRSEPLTEREREVAVLVAQGLTNRQVGEQLFITEGTAKLHVKHILQKLDMMSRAQIAAWVTERRNNCSNIPSTGEIYPLRGMAAASSARSVNAVGFLWRQGGQQYDDGDRTASGEES